MVAVMVAPLSQAIALLSLKVEASAKDSYILSVVIAIVCGIENYPEAWGNGDIVIDLEAVESLNMIRGVWFPADIATGYSRR